MKKPRDYAAYREVYFRPEFDSCPGCGSRLVRHHTAWSKHIRTMRGNIHATNYAYSCSNEGCGRIFRSTEADMLSLPFRTYSIDIMVEIGFLRHDEKRSIPEIHKDLMARGIEICEREVYELVHVFEELIAIRPVEFDPDFYDAVMENGGIVLAIDGVQPESGNSTLYVLQDALTSKVLYAEYLDNSSSGNIAEIISTVRDALHRIGLEIISVISDHQHSIRLGVKKALPGIKHQFCHFHVLRNALLPISDRDRALKKDIRKRIRGLSAIEESLSRRNDDCSHIRDACSLTRSLLIYPGSMPLEFSGMAVFQHLAALDGTLRRMISSRDDRDLRRLASITGRWREFVRRYRDLSALVQYANSLRLILSSTSSSEDVKKSLSGFMDSVRAKIREGGIWSDLDPMVETLENHWDGLFFCYDDPRIPRTDNGLEITIRRIKTGYRRVSGFQSWDSFMAQYGRSTFMIPPSVSREQLIEMAGDVPRDQFMERWKQFNSRRGIQSLMRKGQNDYSSALKELEMGWTQF
ncbi:MAG: transposase [Thermoplasmataceae archaeon]